MRGSFDLKKTLLLFLKDVKLVVRDVLGTILVLYFFIAPLLKLLISRTLSLVGTSVVFLLSLIVGD